MEYLTSGLINLEQKTYRIAGTKGIIDENKYDYEKYSAKITWVSDKAEFTPKTIQTKNERANWMYPIKVSVSNDGYLKIGMYGEVRFNAE